MTAILSRLGRVYGKRSEIRRQLAWLAGKARLALPQLTLLFLLETAVSGIGVYATLVNKQIIDHAIQAAGSFDTAAFVLFVVLTAANIAFGLGGHLFSSRITVRYSMALRAKLYERVLKTKWSALKGYHSGDIQSRLMGDLESACDGILSLVPDAMGLTVRLVLAFFVLFGYDRMLALAALLLGPIGLMSSTVFLRRMNRLHRQGRENDAALRSYLQESTENVVVLKAFSMEEERMRRYEALRAERVSLVWKRDVFGAASRLSLNVVFTAGHLLALGWGILRVSRGEITYGTMSIFLSLISQIQSPIIGMGDLITRFVSLLSAAGRVMELEALEAEPPKQPTGLSGAVGVRLENVTFRYSEQDAPVLEDVSLHIEPGESVALVGSTGAGKTTVARLLLDLIDPVRGAVTFFDAHGHTAPASPSTRELIAYVPQGNTLSSGTIRENLLAGTEADASALREALRIAEAGFAEDLGLDTRIGERGIGLSEGQAQRIAIARALLRPAPFLILDEASASLDMETEQRIMENLRSADLHKTCLVITHRPSLLALCDRCYRVEGTGVREGTDVGTAGGSTPGAPGQGA